MFQSKKPKSSRGIRHSHKFRLRTDVSCDTQCPCVLNTQLPRVIADRTIHHGLVIDGGVLAKTNEISCWQAKPCPLTKNFPCSTKQLFHGHWKFLIQVVCLCSCMKDRQLVRKCDAIWKNPSHVAQGSFAEINKIILKLLCFSLFFY